jgi:hypothetical protein
MKHALGPWVWGFFFLFWSFFNYILRNEFGQKKFRSISFESQLTWLMKESCHMHWRSPWGRRVPEELMWCHVGLSCANRTGTTESRRLLWCNWVTLSAVAWLAVQPPCAVCPPITPEQSAQPSHASPVDVTDLNLNQRATFLPPLSSLFPSSLFSLVPEATRHSRSRRRRWLASSGHHSSPNAVLLLPKGSSFLWTV